MIIALAAGSPGAVRLAGRAGVLPRWFTEEASDLCQATLRDGGGKPLVQRVADAIDAFGRLGVTVAQLEQRVGRPSAEWLGEDLGALQVLIMSMRRGEISKDEAFPAERVTADDITGQRRTRQKPADGPEGAGPIGAPPAASSDSTAAPAPARAARAASGQVGIIARHFKRIGFADDERDQRLSATSTLAGREVGSTKDLTQKEAHAVAAALAAYVPQRTNKPIASFPAAMTFGWE